MNLKIAHHFSQILLSIVLGLTTNLALAYTQQWNWQFSGQSFTSKQAAVAYMHSLSATHSYFTVEEGPTWISQSSVDYRYTAPMKSGQALSAWSYFSGLYGGASQPTESALVAQILAQIQAGDDSRCPASTYQPTGDWQWVSGFYGQVSSRETKGYQRTTYSYSTPSCIEHVSSGQNIYRDRWAGCLSPYTATSVAPHCELLGSLTITGHPLMCASAGTISGAVGNPCDVATGDKIQRETDYSGAGLSFERIYHSQTLESGHAMGVGWTHNFNATLVIDSGTPSGLIRPSGYHDALRFQSANFYISDVSGLQLRKSGSDWILYKSNGDTEVYNSTGRLIRLVIASGQITALTYTSGVLSSVAGPFGHSLQFSYNAGKISQVVDPAGEPIGYSYDSNGNLAEVTYPDGKSRIYHYENTLFPNHLTGITDENGDRFSTYAYDSSGRATSTEHAGGTGKLTLSYLTNSTTVTDQDSNVTTYNFTTENFARKITQIAVGGLSHLVTAPGYATDFQRRATQETDERGVVTHYVYDRDHMTSRTEAYGTSSARTTTYEYLSTDDDLVTRQTSPSVSGGGRLREILTTYNSQKQPTQIKIKGFRPDATPIERTTSFTYNSAGQVLTVDGPRIDVSDITTLIYYSCTAGYECGRLASITNASGHVTTFDDYDAHGRVLEKTDSNGLVTTFTYDLRGRVLSTILTPLVGAARMTTYTYDDVGQLETVTQPNGSTVTYDYDAAHQLTSITDTLGNRIQYAYDLRGNRESEEIYDPSDVLTRAISYIHDVRNQLRETNNHGAITETVQDAVGLVTSDEDPNGNGSTYQYDALRRLTQTLNALSGTTTNQYDVNDKLTQVTAPNGSVTQYLFDDLGNQLQEISADTGTTNYTYDAASNVISRTDARSVTVTYTYDVINRVTSISYPSQTLAYEYDSGIYAIGRLTERWSRLLIQPAK